jgi:hypothetical protein
VREGRGSQVYGVWSRRKRRGWRVPGRGKQQRGEGERERDIEAEVDMGAVETRRVGGAW